MTESVNIKLLRKIRVQLEVNAEHLKKQFDEPLEKACFHHCRFNEEIKPQRREHNLHLAQINELLADEIGQAIAIKEIE